MQRPGAAYALSTPWCWPADATLAADALAMGYAAPSPLGVGEVLLVSVAAEREALWRLSWDQHRRPEGRPFRGDAEGALDEAAALATAVAPHLHSLRMLGERPRSATQVLKRGRGADEALDGASFGLPMLLALCSRLTERVVPARFAASAVLRPDGTLGRVGGLDRKLALLADGALGVDTVLVAAEQLDEARGLLVDSPWLAAVGAATARGAVDVVFAGAREAPPGAWAGQRAAQVTGELLALCSRGGQVTEWRAVERSARWLQAASPPGSPQHVRATFARQVAERHANGHGFEIPWDDAIDAGRDRAKAAHVVQAAADAGSPSLAVFLGRARALLCDPPEGDDLRLLGAVGRGLAAMRRYREAGEALERATDAWIELGDRGECSRPLAEWLRAAALASDSASWERAAQQGREHLDATEPADIGALFVRYALGRGLCTRGRAGEALAVLDGAAWLAAPAFLARSRARWRSRCLHALGRADEAATERAAIGAATDDDGGVAVEARFVALDVALERGEDCEAAVAAVRGASPQGIGWLTDATLTTTEQARRLADEYAY